MPSTKQKANFLCQAEELLWLRTRFILWNIAAST
jgi:hypothetical protein